MEITDVSREVALMLSAKSCLARLPNPFSYRAVLWAGIFSSRNVREHVAE